ARERRARGPLAAGSPLPSRRDHRRAHKAPAALEPPQPPQQQRRRPAPPPAAAGPPDVGQAAKRPSAPDPAVRRRPQASRKAPPKRLVSLPSSLDELSKRGRAGCSWQSPLDEGGGPLAARGSIGSTPERGAAAARVAAAAGSAIGPADAGVAFAVALTRPAWPESEERASCPAGWPASQGPPAARAEQQKARRGSEASGASGASCVSVRPGDQPTPEPGRVDSECISETVSRLSFTSLCDSEWRVSSQGTMSATLSTSRRGSFGSAGSPRTSFSSAVSEGFPPVEVVPTSPSRAVSVTPSLGHSISIFSLQARSTTPGTPGKRVVKPNKTLRPGGRRAATGSAGSTPVQPEVHCMDQSDSEGEYDESHVRTICFEVVNERLNVVQQEVDRIVGTAVKSAISEETETITSAFKSNFDKCMAACKKDMDEFPKKMDKHIMAVVTPKLDALRTEAMQRCDEIRGEIQQVDARVSEHDRLLGIMQSQIQQLQQALVVANSQQPAPKALASSASFEREIDATVVKINAGRPARSEEARSVITPWPEEMQITSDMWSLPSPDPIAKMFALQVSGATGLASRRVQKILSGLRTSSSQWRELEVPTQAGGTTRLHFSGDKNPKQIKTETTGRKFRTKLQEIYGREQRIFVDRDRGWLSLGWDALCKIEVFPGREETKLFWNPGTIAKYGKSKAELLEAVRELLQPDREPEWCL
ncbi:unnamed protein product, partial [Prorocentrum cordatum]